MAREFEGFLGDGPEAWDDALDWSDVEGVYINPEREMEDQTEVWVDGEKWGIGPEDWLAFIDWLDAEYPDVDTDVYGED